MDFGLPEEQLLLQETVRGFVEKPCPRPRLRELFEEGSGDAPALGSVLTAMGIAGLAIPVPRGGSGLEAEWQPLASGASGTWTSRMLGAIGVAIAGGASNIQRNIFVERGLGLPRDLRATK